MALLNERNLYDTKGSGYIFVMAKERGDYKSKASQEVDALTYRQFLTQTINHIKGFATESDRNADSSSFSAFLSRQITEAKQFEGANKEAINTTIELLELLLTLPSKIINDPRFNKSNPKTITDKEMAVGGGAALNNVFVQIMKEFNEIRTPTDAEIAEVFNKYGRPILGNDKNGKPYEKYRAKQDMRMSELFQRMFANKEIMKGLEQYGVTPDSYLYKQIQKVANKESTRTLKATKRREETEIFSLDSFSVGSMDEVLHAVSLQAMLDPSVAQVFKTGDEQISYTMTLNGTNKKVTGKVKKGIVTPDVVTKTAKRKADLEVRYEGDPIKGLLPVSIPVSLKSYEQSKKPIKLQEAINGMQLENLLTKVYKDTVIVSEVMSGLLSYQKMRAYRLQKMGGSNKNIPEGGLRLSTYTRNKDKRNDYDAQGVSNKAYVHEFLSLVLSNLIVYFLGTANLYADMNNATIDENSQQINERDTIRVFGYNRGIFMRSIMLESLRDMQNKTRKEKGIDSRFDFAGRPGPKETQLYDESIAFSFLRENPDFTQANPYVNKVYNHKMRETGGARIKGNNSYAEGAKASETIADINTQEFVQRMYEEMFKVIKITPKISVNFEVLKKRQG